MKYTIQRAGIQHLALIRELTFQVWPQTYAPILSEAQIHYMLNLMYSKEVLALQLTDPEHIFIIIHESEQPVAFASYSPHNGLQWKLHKLYILPAWQGKGVGHFIIHHIIADLKKRGAASLILNVNRYNKARIFYEKAGFKTIATTDVPIGNGYFMNDYIMEIKMEDH